MQTHYGGRHGPCHGGFLFVCLCLATNEEDGLALLAITLIHNCILFVHRLQRRIKLGNAFLSYSVKHFDDFKWLLSLLSTGRD